MWRFAASSLTFFSITNVRGVFKEIEGFRTPQAWIEIQNDIQLSRAIFVLLGPHVQEIKHTRDWVVWESAIGSPMRKEIWVFEPYEHLGKIDVIIPHVDHYMIFQEKLGVGAEKLFEREEATLALKHANKCRTAAIQLESFTKTSSVMIYTILKIKNNPNGC